MPFGGVHGDDPAFDGNDDGIPDYQDPDSDGDGILDVEEGTVDTDGDGFWDGEEVNAKSDPSDATSFPKKR